MNRPVLPEHTRWKVNPYSWEAAQQLSRALGIPPAAGVVLAGRGLADPVEARRFLAGEADIPDLFLFSHMESAVEAISRAIDTGGRVVVHGDYDADGITATAVMVLGLRELGLEAEWYLPSRFKEGYGLSRTAVDSISAAGPALLITVDCGVNYPDEVALARELGLEVVVVDHHQPGPVLPDCHLIHAAVGCYPHGTLCGVGLALKVLHAAHVRRRGASPTALPKELEGLLDLVAIGTIADLAALVGENRYYVREGLKLVAIGQRVGLRALASVSGCTGSTDSSTVAYRLAPRLNAAGRLADPSPPLRLLLTQDEKEATALAQELHELNGARQDVERQMLEQAVQRVEEAGAPPSVIVLAGKEWHEGVVGIVAARLVERYHRPAILLGVKEGVAKGSGRSIGRFDIVQALTACADHLIVYGGHPQAVGLTLEADRVDDFRAAIEQHASTVLDVRDLVPTFRSDAVLRGEDVTADTALALAALGPFGSANPKPRLLLTGADLLQADTTRDGSHLRCTVSVDGVKARGIGFGMGQAVPELQGDGSGRLVGVQFQVDSWQGALRPEFVIEHVGAPPASGAPLCDCGPTCPWWLARPTEGVDAEQPAAHSAPGHAPAPSVQGPAAPLTPPTALRMPIARDLRDRPGRVGALAQVLATGERTLVLGCALPHMLEEPRKQLPLADLSPGGLVCAGRACAGRAVQEIEEAAVVAAEWDVATRWSSLAACRTHIVAVDPPYRAQHAAFLEEAARAGAHIHLYYGSEERENTQHLLRYLVHPRFAMVCAYRAWQADWAGGAGDGEEALLSRAAVLAWEEAGVALGRDDLARAFGFLRELRLDQVSAGEAKLEARNIPAYASAEADYEECSRLCQNL
jgi:single-stranded-DNA-specific exonuclease